MKIKMLILSICSIISFSACAEPAGHWGVGIGSSYGGPGVKFSQGVSENMELYANGGASALFALLCYRSGTVVGIGAEYAFTGNQHHTLNLGYAILTSKQNTSWNVDEQRYIKYHEHLTGSVVGYTYYFSGLKSKGQAVGISLVHLMDNKKEKPMQTVGDAELKSVSVSWGYRF